MAKGIIKKIGKITRSQSGQKMIEGWLIEKANQDKHFFEMRNNQLLICGYTFDELEKISNDYGDYRKQVKNLIEVGIE